MAGKKAGKPEVEYRINLVQQLMINGIRQRYRIHQYITDMDKLSTTARAKSKDRNVREWQPWKVCERQIDIYIAQALVRFKQTSRFDREEEIGHSLERLEDLYVKCIAHKKFAVAERVQKQIEIMKGIFEQRIHADGSLRFDIEATRKDLEKRIGLNMVLKQ